MDGKTSNLRVNQGATKQTMGISLKPSTAITGGTGLIQDVDVTVTKSQACVTDFNGKVSPAVGAVHMEFTLGDGTTKDEYYSFGALNRLAPGETEDGPALTNVGEVGNYIIAPEGSTATGLSDSCTFMFFVREAANCGFPAEEKLESDVSIFEGMEFHGVRKVNPLTKPKEGAAERKYGPSTVFVPSKISKYPWDAKGKSKAATAAAGGAKGGADVNAVAVKAIQDVLAKSNGSVKPADARKVAFPVLHKSQTSAVRDEVLKLILSDEWLAANQGPDSFLYEDGTITKV